MQVRYQLYSLAALSPEKDPLISSRQAAVWATKPAWTLALAGN
jgi:hypothetical protein